MHAQKLARAIVHWLEYEHLCNRSNLISEASLTTPIGEFLNSSQNLRVEAEKKYPGTVATKGRPRQMDFALIKRGKSTIAHMIESKWITEDRDFKQEIFDDLLRLETADYKKDEGRWLVIAGQSRHIQSSVEEAKINSNGSRIKAFDGILSFDKNTPRINARVADNSDKSRLNLWIESARSLGTLKLPKSMTIKLIERATSGTESYHFHCLIWQIQSVRNRAELVLDQLE